MGVGDERVVWTRLMSATELDKLQPPKTILSHLDNLVKYAKDRNVLVGDVLKDNVIHRLMQTELFTSEVLTHPLFDCTKDGDAGITDAELMIRESSWKMVEENIWVNLETFPFSCSLLSQSLAHRQGQCENGVDKARGRAEDWDRVFTPKPV